MQITICLRRQETSNYFLRQKLSGTFLRSYRMKIEHFIFTLVTGHAGPDNPKNCKVKFISMAKKTVEGHLESRGH